MAHTHCLQTQGYFLKFYHPNKTVVRLLTYQTQPPPLSVLSVLRLSLLLNSNNIILYSLSLDTIICPSDHHLL